MITCGNPGKKSAIDVHVRQASRHGVRQRAARPRHESGVHLHTAGYSAGTQRVRSANAGTSSMRPPRVLAPPGASPRVGLRTCTRCRTGARAACAAAVVPRAPRVTLSSPDALAPVYLGAEYSLSTH